MYQKFHIQFDEQTFISVFLKRFDYENLAINKKRTITFIRLDIEKIYISIEDLNRTKMISNHSDSRYLSDQHVLIDIKI